MYIVRYGSKDIQFNHKVNKKLKHAYITVDFYKGVVLKSPPMEESKAKQLVLKKGAWIFEKLKLVEQIPQGEIETGSRLLYLGKRYYTGVLEDISVKGAVVQFNYSKFSVSINPNCKDRQEAIAEGIEYFFRQKAIEKIAPRIKRWIELTGLKPADIKYRKLSKRWGGCTIKNEIIINFDAVKLPWRLIDYIIVHELCHLKHKKHSKGFWHLVKRHLPDYKEKDDEMMGMKL
jgi:predicted metal-dependent hydrolase